jgi:ribokinase
MSSEILVIGSLNMDLVVQTSRLPQAGETLAGSEFHLIPGGKGANQAVAASRSGAKTHMIGCVGDDAFSEIMLESLRIANVDVKGVSQLSGISTGTATIIVEGGGENRIIIIPGANGRVTNDLVEQKWDLIARSDMVILQHEIPLTTIHSIIKNCQQKQIPVLLNPAPMYPIPMDILAALDTLVVNEAEAAALTGDSIKSFDTAKESARKIMQSGVKTVIITLGENGAILMDNKGYINHPGYKVAVIDTTAAGDTFVGGYSASITEGKSSTKALEYACAASAIAVMRLGAQTSIPTRVEVENFLQAHHQQTEYF